MEMIISIASTALLVFALLVIVINSLIGARRGILRAAIRAILLFVSIPVTVWIAKPIASIVAKASSEAAVTLLASSGMDMSVLDSGSGELNTIIAAIVTILIAPIIFLALHWIVSLLTKIADKPLKRLLEDLPLPEGGISKLIGALIGVLCGILILTTLLSPITGYLAIADQAMQIALPEEEQNPISAICDSPVVKLNRALGGKWLFNSLTTTRLHGERVRLVDEVDTAVLLYGYAMDVTERGIASWDEREIEGLQNAATAFEDSVIVADLAATVISDACSAWSRGELYMNAPKPQFSEVIDPTLDVLYEVLANSTTATFRQNIHTFADIACAMIEYDVFETIAEASTGEANETVAYLSVATNKDFTDAVIDALYHDEQLRVLIPEVMNLSLRAVAYSMNLPGDKDEMYDRILQETADALASGIGQADIERMVTLGDELYSILTGYGVDISPVTAAGMAAGMIADFAADTEINPDDIAAWFAEYAAASAKEKADSMTQSINPTLIPLSTDNTAPSLVLLSNTKRTFSGAQAAAKYIAQQNARANPYQILSVTNLDGVCYRIVSMSGGSMLVFNPDGMQINIDLTSIGSFTVAENGAFIAATCKNGWKLTEKPRRITAEELNHLIRDTLSPLPEDYVPVVATTDSTAVTSTKLQNAQNKGIVVTDIDSLLLSLSAAANHELASGAIKTAGAESLASSNQLQSSLPCRSDMVMQDVISIAQNLSRENALTVSTALNSVATLLGESTSSSASPDQLAETLMSDAGSGAISAIIDSMTAISGSNEQAKNTLLAGAAMLGADIVSLKNALDLDSTSPSDVASDLLSSAGTLVSLTDESLTTEQKIERISTMLTNLTESGARAIASAISPAMLSDMGLPSEISATCASLVSSAFLTLADAKANGMSEEQFDREADAMTSMLNLAVSVGKGEHNSSHLFGTDGILGCTADSLLDTVTGSNMISTALLSMVGAGNDAFFTVSNHDPLGIGSLGEADDTALLAAIEHAEQALSSYPSSTGALWSPTNNTVTRQDMARRLCAFASIFGLEYDSEYVDIKQ